MILIPLPKAEAADRVKSPDAPQIVEALPPEPSGGDVELLYLVGALSGVLCMVSCAASQIKK